MKRITPVDYYTIRVVARSLDILELLRDARTALSLQEISHRLGTAKSSTFRLLRTLERRGYVERMSVSGSYVLGPEWMTYAGRLPGHRALSEVALPFMERLRDRFMETANLGVLRRGEILYVEILESPRSFRMAAAVGSRSPVHSTALGKAIAASLPDVEVSAIARRRGLPAFTPRTITSLPLLRRELDRVRARGFAEDNAENEPEASCIAAPIFGPDREVVAAISISGPTSRIQAIKPEATPALVEVCTVISRTLGYREERVGKGEVTGKANFGGRG